MYNVTLRRISATIVAVAKEISITYAKWVSAALVIQHAMRMRRVICSSVSCLCLQYFSTLSHKWHDLKKCH